MRALLLAPTLLLAGCLSTKAYLVHEPTGPFGPREVAFLDSGTPAFSNGAHPIARDLAEQLRARGFQVKRFAKDDGSVRYGLELRGEARLECGTVGYTVEWMEVDVVDLAANERVATFGGQGYTEGCIDGTLLGRIADQMRAAWGSPAPTPKPADAI